MEDLSLHILDVAENSLRAGASRVAIRLSTVQGSDLLILEIVDNGSGMDESTATATMNPFFTTKEGKRFGLGIPLLAQSAEETGGSLTVQSVPGQGTTVRALFHTEHVDMKPLGDLSKTISVLQASHPQVTFDLEVTERSPDESGG